MTLYANATLAFRTLVFVMTLLSGFLVSEAIVKAQDEPPDCNGNSQADNVDIELGLARDINGNGIPDACEGATQIPGDLNQNGRFDSHDPRLLLERFFLGPPVYPCGNGKIRDPANVLLLDANGNGEVDSSDSVYLFRNLFLDAPPHVLGFDCIPLPGCEMGCEGPQDVFRRGDVNASGRVNLIDPVDLLLFMFHGRQVVSCEKAADANDDGQLDTTDALIILRFIFLLGSDLPSPFSQCGVDPIDDLLSCHEFSPCE